MTTTELSQELKNKITARLEKLGNPLMYWDQGQELSISQVIEAIEREPESPLNHIDDELMELNIDNAYDMEVEHLKYAMEHHDDEIAEELGVEHEDLDVKEIASDMRDEFMDHLGVDMNIKGLCKGHVPIRIEMTSNYDCINSHWLESSEEYSMDSYFGDMVRQLGLNPQLVKGILKSKGYKVAGEWPLRSDKDALISYEDFLAEHRETSCGANLLTLIGSVDAYELLKLNHTKKMRVTIPKDNLVGLYSSMQGGGSMFEAKLLRPFTIEIGKSYDESGYLKYRLEIDNPHDNYSISSCYGVSSSFFDGDIKIEQID